MHLLRSMLLLFVAVMPLSAKAQALADSADSSNTVAITSPAPPDLTYLRPTTKIKLHSYVFDAFGPYPIVGGALAAGINQADNTPPESRVAISVCAADEIIAADGSVDQGSRSKLQGVGQIASWVRQILEGRRI
jgi:hypothetical protein